MRYNLHYRVGASNWKGWKHLGQWETLSETQDELQSWQNSIRPNHGDIARIVGVKKDGGVKPSAKEWGKNWPIYIFNENEWVPAAHMKSIGAGHWMGVWEAQWSSAMIILPFTHGVPTTRLIEACFSLVDRIPNSMPVAQWVNRSSEFIEITGALAELRRAYVESDTTMVAAISGRIDRNLMATGRQIGRTVYRERLEYLATLKELAEMILVPIPNRASQVARHVQNFMDIRNGKMGSNRYKLREIVWKHITMSHAICGAMGLRQPTY